MKKVFLLMALACACVCTSCEKDDDSPKEPTASLIGKWERVGDYTQGKDEWINDNHHKEGKGHYWEFSATEVAVNDPCDLLYGTRVEYSYDPEAKKLTLFGFVATVETLTAKDLILISGDQKICLKKMN